jgi:serine/threonine protein kinase
MATHANCLPVGTVIADFEIIGLVGEGGFGIVYLARDVHLDRVVAVKEFMPSAFAGRVDGTQVGVRSTNHQATYEAGLRSFINEAKMLARFSHPSLVEVYRFWEGNGTAYMAMRYYEGETLRQHLARADMAFDEETIAQTMSPVFDALEMLHREQVYHRDIAPDNIMISDGRPVLLDFGSARRIIGDGTQALTTVLKPGYAPIEQYVDDGTMKQGPWTDVYALGGVLYHLATGKPPPQAVSRLLSDPLQPIHAVMGDRFSMTFSDAVTKAMAVRVEDRLQNVNELREMLGWNVAQSARVMTLPGTSSARQTTIGSEPRVQTITKNTGQVLATQPKPVTANAAALPAKSPDVAVSIILDESIRGEKPVHAPEAAAKRDIKVPLFTVGLGVLIIAFYLFMRPSPSVDVTAPESPVNNSALVTKPTNIPTKAPETQIPILPAPAPAVVAETGIIKLDIRPWGTVVVDGITRGISNETQLRQVELQAGTHTIELAKPGSPTHTQTVELRAGSSLTISHVFK